MITRKTGKLLLMLAVIVAEAAAIAQSSATQPAGAAGTDAAALELRANQEFDAGRYAVALPLLEKVAVMNKDDRAKVEPILEKIRVCQRNIAAGNGGPGAEELTGPRRPHPKPQPGEVRDLEIKELGNFDYDADRGGNIPVDVQALNGATLRITGFMIPMDQADNITQFALVPSLFACCFGQPPTIQHTIVVNCPDGKAVSYYPDEIIVQGTLLVEEKKEDDFIVSIFEMEAESVKPAVR